MPRSLSSRLLLAFAFVIVLSLAVSGTGTLLFLRDQQREAAEERVGRLAEPLTLAVALWENFGLDSAQIQNAVRVYADSFDVRVLLIDQQGRVVLDTDSDLTGTSMAVLTEPGGSVTRRGDSQFRMAKYNIAGEDMFLFYPVEENLHLSSSDLVELQTFLYRTDTPSISNRLLRDEVTSLLQGEGAEFPLPGPSLRPVVAVPEAQITSAWQEIMPQIAIAGTLALLAGAVVALLIARSISRPLAKITIAAQEMAHGRYEQKLDVRGDDDVGRLAQAFNDMAQQVSGSHQMMRDLLANVSHELKTPLTSIQGFSQALEEEAISSPEEYKEAGRIINEEAQRMRRLVDDLIELSRLESGQALVQREQLDLQDLLRVCARRFERQAQEQGTTVRLDVPPLPTLQGDERRLEQVFSNLIENAVRHTPAGGAIDIRAAALNGNIRVAVHNTGSYIPDEDLPRVFERFFQVDRNRASGVGGSGLGLAIASEVVHAHQGAIHATSDREQGTEFVVSLPVNPDAPTDARKPSP